MHLCACLAHVCLRASLCMCICACKSLRMCLHERFFPRVFKCVVGCVWLSVSVCFVSTKFEDCSGWWVCDLPLALLFYTTTQQKNRHLFKHVYTYKLQDATTPRSVPVNTMGATYVQFSPQYCRHKKNEKYRKLCLPRYKSFSSATWPTY